MTSKIKRCGPAKVLEVLEPATRRKPRVHVDCHLVLGNANIRVTKQLVIYGAERSGVTVDCNGATIAPAYRKESIKIQSLPLPGGGYTTPSHIKIRECRVKAPILVGLREHIREVRRSSRRAGHTQRMQAAAPSHIVLSRMTFEIGKSNALYVGNGVTHLTLEDSEIKGTTRGTAIYLDAESAHNTIRNNKIHKSSSAPGKATKREQIAIDGSAHNKIIGNHFSGLNHGGIHIYRNSGERAVVRHQKPQHNQIINNYFYYNKYTGDEQAIHIGSRMGSREDHNSADDGFEFGSSISNLDHAKHNVVAENQVRKRGFNEVLKVSDTPNYFFENSSVTARQLHKSGCYYGGDGKPTWTKHGKVTTTATGNVRCDDGVFKAAQ